MKIAIGKLRYIIREILEEESDFHRNTFEDRLRKTIHNIVVGGLRDAIHSHGPITPQFIGSATKRIAPQLLAYIHRQFHGISLE